MATHSSILAWEIPWKEDPGGLQSMGLQKSWTPLSHHSNIYGMFTAACQTQRVGHNLATEQQLLEFNLFKKRK